MSRAVSMLTQPREWGAVALNPGALVNVVHVSRGAPAAHRFLCLVPAVVIRANSDKGTVRVLIRLGDGGTAERTVRADSLRPISDMHTASDIAAMLRDQWAREKRERAKGGGA